MNQSSPEIRVCVDVGSQKHYVAIGLSSGEHLTEFEFHHTPCGIDAFFQRLENLRVQHHLPIAVAMEGYNGYARPIDSYVLAKGYRLYNVNNTKLARFKEIFPSPAKTDPIDAWKIFELFTLKDTLPLAKNALQEVEKSCEINERLKAITRRRRELVNEKTRVANRLQADLESICPGILSLTGSVDNIWFLSFLTFREDLQQLLRLHKSSLLKIKGVGRKYANLIQEWQKTAKFAPSVAWISKMVLQDAKRMLELHYAVEELNKTIEMLNANSELAARLMTLPGCGTVCAGELAGEIGTISRFPSEASLAMYVGMAVLDKSSGKHVGTKNPRNVNTRAKAAMMVVVARHVEQVPEAKKYYDKKRSEGKKHNQALRSLGRHLVRVIWSMIMQKRGYVMRNLPENLQNVRDNECVQIGVNSG
jgi:transposase